MTNISITIIGFTVIFLMTTLGSAVVFFFKKDISPKINTLFLGFAAGIMIAASVWSLLIPSIEGAEASQGWMSRVPWLPAAVGFICGGLFLVLLDKVVPHFHPGTSEDEGPHTSLKKSVKLFLAVTIHNIPEGMAVGFAFGGAAAAVAAIDPTLAATAMGTAADSVVTAITTASSTATAVGIVPAASAAAGAAQGAAAPEFLAALGLALGIGIQNFPEGAAVALPMKQATGSRMKAFLFGMGSGAVEPVSAIVGYFIASSITSFQPWFLAFAAGAMIFVVAEDLIPDSKLDRYPHLGTWGVMAGFVIMMVLDVALG